MITLLNCAILTGHGEFSYKPITLEEAKSLINSGFQSAIGHQSTAQILSELLGVEVLMNRIQYKQHSGDKAIVFSLNRRGEEGKIYTKSEIEEIGYTLNLLEMK